MDCIFKIYGFVPETHICRGCEPLKIIVRSVGYSEKESIEISRRILRALQIIKLEDIFRDEGILKKLIAKFISVPLIATLPKIMREKMKDINMKIRRLENSEICADGYVKEVAQLGGSLFESAANAKVYDNKLNHIGSTLTAATLVSDMNKDLGNDLKKRKFNPFKKCNKKTTNSITKKHIKKFEKFAQATFTKKITIPNTGPGFVNLAGDFCFGDCLCC